MMHLNEAVIEDVRLMDNGTLEVIKRELSHAILTCMPPRPAPDRIYKEIYVAEGGKIVLDTTIEGTHIPATTIPEKFEFPKE